MQTTQVLSAILKDITIFYVEDDLSTQEIISEILEEFCSDVKVASNGEEAYEIFQNEKVDPLITDIEMPKKNGIELVKAIREESRTFPVIILSAYSTHEYLLSSANLKIEAYIIKPVTFSKIKEALLSVAKTLNETKNIYVKISKELSYDRLNGSLVETDKKIDLQKKERDLMNLLVENRGNLVTYSSIEKALWSNKDEVMTSTALRTVVKKLRAETEFDSIENISGSGYKLRIS